MIKKNILEYSKNFNTYKNPSQRTYESRNKNGINIPKTNLDIEEKKPIKVHLLGKSQKNKKKEINNNIPLISSFLQRKKFKNYSENNLNTSSFQKTNLKLINNLNTEDSFIRKIIKKKSEDKRIKKIENGVEKKSKLTELLKVTKENKKNNSNLIKNGITPIENIKKFDTEDFEDKIEKRNHNLNESNDINKYNYKKRTVLNLVNNVYNKEKLYNLIYEKNSFNSKGKKIINKTNDDSEINNNNDNKSKSEYKQFSNKSKYKMRNVITKNFNIENQNDSGSLKINNHIRKSKSPIGLTVKKNLVKNIKENTNKEQITNLKSNNYKKDLKINLPLQNITNESNNDEKMISDFNSNSFIENEKNKKLIYNPKVNYNNNSKKKYIKLINNEKEYNLNSDSKDENFISYQNRNESDLGIDSNNRSVTSYQYRNEHNIDIDINKSVELKNKLNKSKLIINDFGNKKNNEDKNEIININFYELILFGEKLNNIYIAIKGNDEENIMKNEVLEFFNFYLNSTLNNKFPYFLSNENIIIIQSSMNLLLFVIMIIYFLSINSEILNEYIPLLTDIFNKFQKNFLLLVRQIEIYYNNVEFFEKNDVKTNFNNIKKLLKKTSFYDTSNLREDEIILKINNNCTNISNNLHSLLNIYHDNLKKNINNNNNLIYYNEFMKMFNQISVLTEKDITNYFYNNIYKKKIMNTKSNTPQKTGNIFLNYKNFTSTKNKSQSKQNNTEIYKHNNINLFSKDLSKNIKKDINLPINEKIKVNKHIPIIKVNGKKTINNISNINLKMDNTYSDSSNIIPPFINTKRTKNKKYTLILDLDETLVYVKEVNLQNKNYSNSNQRIINLRPGLFSFLNTVKPYYEIISFSCASKTYADNIIKKIETNQKYFDYNLYREHTTLYGTEYVKDISKIGRNIKEMIIVDNLEQNFILNPDNGIKIASYYGKNSIDDNKLYELQKLLILFYKLKYDDLRMAIKDYSQYIKNKISTTN